MLGLDMKMPTDEQVTEVELKANETIELVIHGRSGIISRKLEWLPEDKVSCDEGKMTIQRTREGRGEAVTGKADITHVLFLDEHASMILTTYIASRSRTLLFSCSNQPELYGARFARLDGRLP